jgi:putative PEP-CTERM system TPR-repeat lipoprotein
VHAVTKIRTNPGANRRWRIPVAAGVAAVAGTTLVAAAASRTEFSEGAAHALTLRVAAADDTQSGLAKLMEQARQAMAQNQPRVAVIFLRNAVAAAPKDSEAHFQLGVALLKTGDTVSAERELRSARQYGTSDERVLPVLFAAMLTRSEDAQLLAQFPAPAESDTSATASATLRARALALSKTGDQKGAVASLDRALSFDRSPGTLLARMQLARSMGDNDLALKLVDETLSKSPKDVVALVTKVELLMQTKQNDKALASANTLVQYYPENAEALMTRAGVYLQLNQHDKALADINISLKAVPGMPLGIYYKALAMEQAQDVKQAWELAQTLPPAFVNSRPAIGFAVSQMAINAGHAEIGTSVLAAAVQNFPKNADARVRLAARYLQLKDPDRALQTLEPMADSSDPRIMVLLAQAYDMQHQYAKSIEYLEKASANGFSSDFLNRRIALSNLEAGNLDTGIDELTKLNAAAPGDAQTAGPLIQALLRKNDDAKALEVAKKLASVAPTNPYGPLYEGELLLQRHDLDGAVSAFSQAVARNKKFVPAIYERAGVLAARGDLEAADIDLRSILSADPNNMMAQIKIAQVAIQAGQNDKAISLLEQAVAAHPKEVLPTLVLSGFEVQQGHPEKAAAAIASFLNKVPDDASALAMQGQIQLAAGKPDQAVATFRQLASAHPKSPQIQLLLAAALTKTGKTKDAADSYRAAMQLAPAAPAPHLGLIELALANKDNAAALSAAQDYAKQQPGPASAQTLARTYAAMNRDGDAEAVLAQSQEKDPNSATLVLLTAILRKNGETQKADTMLADWINKRPNDVTVRLAYAQAQLKTNLSAAETQYRAVLESQPYNLEALNNLGWLLQQKNPKEALPYTERAAKLAPNSGAVLDTLAWTKWQLNDKTNALELLQRAHIDDANNGEITYHLVVALDATGRHTEAKKLLADLLASNENFVDKEAAEALQAKWR